MFTLSQIEVFVALSEEKSFSNAAMRLGITQSAVSHAIKKLEQELGVYLISREQKKFFLTEMGNHILIYCKEIHQQIHNIKEEVDAHQNGTKGIIRLGTVWSVANSILPKLINSWKRKFPKVDISVFEGTDQEIEEWLLKGVVDMGIFSGSHPELDLIKLTQDQFFAVVSEENPLSQFKKLKLRQLEAYPFIMSKGGCEPLILSLLNYHQVSLNIKFHAREVLTIATMVRENLGVSLIPELALPKFYQRVKYIPLEVDFKRNIYLGMLKRGRAKNQFGDFITHIQSLPLNAKNR